MTMVTFDPQQLDRIGLDGFSVKRPSGAMYYPHKGQSVWAFGYGRSAEDTALIRDRISAADTGTAQLRALCEFVATECPKHDLVDPRTGQPYPQFRTPAGEIDPDAVMKLPDQLLGYVAQRLLGIESEGEGDGGSGS